MIKNIHKHPAVVLGLTANGLSVIRNLHRHGIAVTGLDNSAFEPAYFTRHARCYSLKSDVLDKSDVWLDYLIEFGKKISQKAVLFSASDKYVVFVAKNRTELSKYFLFNLPDDDTLDIAINKGKLFEAALNLGIPVPRSYFSKDGMQLENIARQVNYPCIIKPAYSHIWRKYYSQKKVEVIHDGDELLEKYRYFENQYPQMPLMIQEIIQGPDSNIYLLMSYFNRKSEPLAIFTPRKLRQYPVDFGIGSFDISEYQPRVVELGLKLLKGLKYRGIAGVEFKRDERDAEFKLMEINARTCLIGEIAIGSGVELPYIAYRDIIGEKVEPIFSFKEGIKWFGLEWDLFSFLEYHRRGKLSILAWFKSLKGKKVYAYFTWDDPLPAFISLIKIFGRLLKSIMKKIRND